VHPVIADINRAHLLSPQPSDPYARLVRPVAVALVASAIDALDPRQPTDWPRYRLLTPHVQALLAFTADYIDDDYLVTLAGAANRLSEAQEWSGALAVAEALSKVVLACALSPISQNRPPAIR
jgi:hypothetical protein